MDIDVLFQRAVNYYIVESSRIEPFLRRRFGKWLPILAFWVILTSLMLMASLPTIPAFYDNSDSSSNNIPDNNIDNNNNATNNTTITYMPTFYNNTNYTEYNNTTITPPTSSNNDNNNNIKPPVQRVDISSYILTWALSTVFLYSLLIIIRMFRLLRMRGGLEVYNAASARGSQVRQILQAIRDTPNYDETTRTDLRARLRLALMGRDFNGDDYEVLQRLDESSIQANNRGMDPIDINRLPTRTITIDDISTQSSGIGTGGGSGSGEKVGMINRSCSICLAEYEVGDCIRTMECMHEYHRDCIDHWLETRTACPVCKYDSRLG